jgi:GNAT superfamily N-acetyltransferase
MLDIYQADLTKDEDIIKGLYTEYLTWVDVCLQKEIGYHFDVRDKVEQDLAKLEMFLPPYGRLLLAVVNSQPTGIGCLRRIRENTGEIKRMYVKPEFRGKGMGGNLVDALIKEAQDMSYPVMRLDSASFMVAAHKLYHSKGFYNIEPYVESEIPLEMQQHWVFMEKQME